MCRTLPGRWSVPLLLLLCTGCASSSLQLLQEPPPYISDIRAEYFNANPDSPYRNDVTVATVVPGMGRFDVLASWGIPSRRVRDGMGIEQWTYYDVDSDSGDAIEYSLMFKNGVLDRWSSRPHKNDGVAYKGRVDRAPLSTTDVEKVDPSDSTEPSSSPGAKKVPKT